MTDHSQDPNIPLRLRILRNLSEALETINPDTKNAQGEPLYRGTIFDEPIDLRGKVFRGRNKLGESDPDITVSILESPQQPDLSTQPVEGKSSFDRWELLIKGDIVDKKNSPTDNCHILMAAVKQCLQLERTRLTVPNPQLGSSNILSMQGAVDQLSVSPGIVRPSEENISPYSFFWLVLTLRIVEDRQDPYRIITAG